jgi:hypothetical protein
MAPDEEASPRHGPGTVLVRLKLEPGSPEEPPRGSIATEGRPAERFRGWIELMAAINAARRRDDGDSP